MVIMSIQGYCFHYRYCYYILKIQEGRWQWALSSQVSIILLLKSVRCIKANARDWHQLKEKDEAGLGEERRERGVNLLSSSVMAVPSCMMVGCLSSFLRPETEKAASHQDMGGDWTKRWVTERGHNTFKAVCLVSMVAESTSYPKWEWEGRKGVFYCEINKQKHPNQTKKMYQVKPTWTVKMFDLSRRMKQRWRKRLDTPTVH